MTRKESLDRLYAILTHSKDCQNVDATKVAFLLRDIFDGFESRVCKNCKYGEYRPVGLICSNEKEVMTTYMSFVDENFGCNRFERRIR